MQAIPTRTLFFALTLMLSGCGVAGSTHWFNQTPLDQQVAYFEDLCLTYGFKSDTDALAQCIAEERRATQLNNLLRTQATRDHLNEFMRDQLLRSRCLSAGRQCH